MISLVRNSILSDVRIREKSNSVMVRVGQTAPVTPIQPTTVPINPQIQQNPSILNGIVGELVPLAIIVMYGYAIYFLYTVGGLLLAVPVLLVSLVGAAFLLAG